MSAKIFLRYNSFRFSVNKNYSGHFNGNSRSWHFRRHYFLDFRHHFFSSWDTFSSLYHHETLTLFFEVFDNNVWELWANISQLLSKRAVITSLGKEPVVNKKPEKINTVWYGFRRTFKLFGSLKLSAGFPKTVCWTSSTFFRVATCLIWLILRDKGRILLVKICMDRDNLLVPLLPATPISVCQMRKSLKLSVRVDF